MNMFLYNRLDILPFKLVLLFHIQLIYELYPTNVVTLNCHFQFVTIKIYSKLLNNIPWPCKILKSLPTLKLDSAKINNVSQGNQDVHIIWYKTYSGQQVSMSIQWPICYLTLTSKCLDFKFKATEQVNEHNYYSNWIKHLFSFNHFRVFTSTISTYCFT